MTFPRRGHSSPNCSVCCTSFVRRGFQSIIRAKVGGDSVASLQKVLMMGVGHRPDMSTVPSRENYRARNNASGLGIGSPGPLGRFLIRGEVGHDTIDELYPIPGEPVIDKPGRGAFAHTDFELLLRNKGIKNLVLAGISTDASVSTTMREASDRGFDCVLLEDGCAAREPSLHVSTCESVKLEGGILGAVAKLDDVAHAVENFKAVTVKKLAPHMGAATQQMTTTTTT